MSFFRFKDEDIINTSVAANPSFTVSLNGNQITGSIYLEKQFLDSALLNRRFEGFSDKEGGFVEKNAPFTSSVDIIDAEQGATNKQFYTSLLRLYDYYLISIV